jgi:hypothetical protein
MKRLSMSKGLAAVGLLMLPVWAFGADLSITAEPYATGGLFTWPVLPEEGKAVTITVRARCEGQVPIDPVARLTLTSSDGKTIAEEKLALKRKEEQAEGRWTWTAGKNGLYRVKAVVDPDGAVAESREDNNAAELVLPVVVKGRKLHFPWYREVPTARWATCVTSTGKEAYERLNERGVLPLNWEYGGMSWGYYDKRVEKEGEAKVLSDIEKLFYEKFTRDGVGYGFGIDECGGYPGTFPQRKSIASMKALVRAKKEMPKRFFAVWNGGGMSIELAPYYRQGADLVLLETYVWRAIPDALGAEDIYQVIRDRIDPIVRSYDMLQPAYGNHCYTLIALDTSERPDRIDLAEQEQVVRFIRRICPEMRGIAWYTGGYGGYGLEKTEETDRHHEAVLANADRLCFDYFIKPCVTLMRESVWVGWGKDGKRRLTAAVSNIGAVDAGQVTVEFVVDGRVVGTQSAASVPAGNGRNRNRVVLHQSIELAGGLHCLEARIVEAADATVLDAVAWCRRMIR